MNCPRCSHRQLEPRAAPPDALCCTTCGGILIERTKIGRVEPAMLSGTPCAHEPSAPDQDISCPRCAATMSRGPYKSTSVEVDFCSSCDLVWCDGFELGDIAWVLSGGASTRRAAKPSPGVIASFTFQRLPTRAARAAVALFFWALLAFLVPKGAFGEWRSLVEGGLLALAALGLLSFRRIRIHTSEGIRSERFLFGLPIRTVRLAPSEIAALSSGYDRNEGRSLRYGPEPAGFNRLVVVSTKRKRVMIWEGTDDTELGDLADAMRGAFGIGFE